MQILKKIFSIFSSDNKYYLELKEEVQDSEVVQTAVKTAEKTAAAAKETAQEVVQSEPVQKAIETAGDALDTAQEKVASAIGTESKPSESKPAKDNKPAAKNGKVASAKAKQGDVAKAEKQETKPAKSAAQNAGASSFDPPFWVAAMNNTNNKSANGNGIVEGETFAENNLMPVATKYRRRPGGSLDKFKDMAKTAKTPRR